MNYNPKMGFSEQDYHLLKTHQSSGSNSKPYELVTVERNTQAQAELDSILEKPLNDIVVFLNVPALGSSAQSTELVLTFTGDGLNKQLYQIKCSKTAKTTHFITFNNTNGFYEMSYSTPADGTIGLDQSSWTAKTFNPLYNNQLGTFTQIPVTEINLSVDSLGADENLPANTIMGVYAR